MSSSSPTTTSILNELETAPAFSFRVKVYNLEPVGSWIDKGTGHVGCNYIHELQGPALVVYSENDPSAILIQSKIQVDDIYERQGGRFVSMSRSLNGLTYQLR